METFIMIVAVLVVCGIFTLQPFFYRRPEPTTTRPDCRPVHNSLIEQQEQTIEDLTDFIERNNVVCKECGLSGLDCHNYQG